MTGYYDVILGLIPIALLGISAVLALLGLELTLAIPLASTVALGLIGHAMFVRSPEGEGSTAGGSFGPAD